MGVIADILGDLLGGLNKHQRRRIDDAEHLLETATRDNERLKAENEGLRKENDGLRARVEQGGSGTLHPQAVSILRVIVRAGSDGPDPAEIARSLRLAQPLVQYRLHNLVASDLVSPDHNPIFDTSYEASTKGRAYVVENNLLETEGQR